ncbi:MAG: LamG domain-containing protein [Anaerolineae bacterium]
MPADRSLDAGAGDLSIVAWVNPASDAQSQPIVTKRYAPADAPLGYSLSLENLEPTFDMANEVSSLRATDRVLTMPLRIGIWELLAVTIQRGSTTGGRLYRNGVPYNVFDTTPLIGAVETQAELHIGEEPRFGRGGAQHYFRGAIDEVQIYHRVLTEAEVRSIYTAGAYGVCGKRPAPTATPRLRPTTVPPPPLAGRRRSPE